MAILKILLKQEEEGGQSSNLKIKSNHRLIINYLSIVEFEDTTNDEGISSSQKQAVFDIKIEEVKYEYIIKNYIPNSLIDICIKDYQGCNIFDSRNIEPNNADGVYSHEERLKQDFIDIMNKYPEPPSQYIDKYSISGFFIPLFDKKIDFQKFEVHFAQAFDNDIHKKSIKELFNNDDFESNTSLLIKKDDLPKLSVFYFTKSSLKFDGSFNYTALRIPEPEMKGVVWLLTDYKLNFSGFLTKDSECKIDSQTNSIFLTLTDEQLNNLDINSEINHASNIINSSVCNELIPPLNSDEEDILRNPGVYHDDPGTFCKPFKHPNRIVAERRFQTILRVTDPEIGIEENDAKPYNNFFDFQLNHTKPSFKVEKIQVKKETGSLLNNFASTVKNFGSYVEKVYMPIAQKAKMSDYKISPIRFNGLNEEDYSSKTIASQIKSSWNIKKEWNRWVKVNSKGRNILSAKNPIEWEKESSINQASSVSFGHIIEFRVGWRNNGYSLGDIAHSLTLAPRQTKRISVIDWTRNEFASRMEFNKAKDIVRNITDRTRDYKDAVESSLSEWSIGGSKSSAYGAAGGLGFAMGPVIIGGGAAYGSASSSSWQTGGRNIAAQEEQHLRDTIRQYGESLRKQESAVVQEISQSETVTGVSEVIRNPNYSHALTVIYYQIFRHLRVETEIVEIRECLFIPFTIQPFNLSRMIRWRDSLEKYSLKKKFNWVYPYLEDFYTQFQHSDIPEGRRCDQPIEYVKGSIFIQIAVERPKEGADDIYLEENWTSILPFIPSPIQSIYERIIELNRSRRDNYFQKEIAPKIIARWANTIYIEQLPDADFTLASEYRYNRTLRIDFTCSPNGSVTRSNIEKIIVKATHPLTENSIANVKRIQLNYYTDTFERNVHSVNTSADLINPGTGETDSLGSELFIKLSRWELENLRNRVENTVINLTLHLNEHIEYYHKAIWWNMDRDRLYMMLDGYEIEYNEVRGTQENPQPIGRVRRSIASLVERDPIAILGNSIVFRVSSAVFLAGGIPKINDSKLLYNNHEELLRHYKKSGAKQSPLLISLPTSGLYAQALMDECEAIEEHMGSIDWVLNDKDPELTELGIENLQSRRADTQNMTPTEFQTPIINLQNSPQAPEPTGLDNIISAVTKSDSFRDMAGLAGTQANVATAMQAAANLANEFGSKVVDLQKSKQGTVMANQKLASIKKAHTDGLITKSEAEKQSLKALEEMNMKKEKEKETLSKEPAIKETLTNASKKHNLPIEVMRGNELVKIGNPSSVDTNRSNSSDLPSDSIVIDDVSVGSYMTTPEYAICLKYSGAIESLLRNFYNATAKAVEQFETRMNFSSSYETVPKLVPQIFHVVIENGINYAIESIKGEIGKAFEIVKNAFITIKDELQRAEKAASSYQAGAFIRKMRESIMEIGRLTEASKLSLPDELYDLYNEMYIDDIATGKQFLTDMQKSIEDIKNYFKEDQALLKHLECNLYERFLEVIYNVSRQNWDINNLPNSPNKGVIEIKYNLSEASQVEYVKVFSPFSDRIADGLNETAVRINGMIDLGAFKCHKWLHIYKNEFTWPLNYDRYMLNSRNTPCEIDAIGLKGWELMNEKLPHVESIGIF